MFNFFKKQAKATQTPATPAPLEQDYLLNENQAEAFAALEEDANGFVELGDVTRNILSQQVQYLSRFLEVDNDRDVFLGEGLTFDTSSSSYHDYTILKSDAIEFVARVRAYRRSIHQPSK